MSGLFGGGGQTISTSAPMLGALRVQTSAFGMAIPAIWGMTRVPANLIWYADFKAIPHTTTTSSGGGGGKGGGGGVSSSNTTYTYQTAVAMGLGEGPIYEVRRAWADKALHTLESLGLTAFLGTYPQAPWGYIETYHPEQAIGYQGIAYVAGASYDLGDSASLPNHTFEVLARMPFDVAGGIFDANPRDFVTELLTAPRFGAGFPAAKLGDLAHYSDYCVALGLFMSPALAEQKPAHEYVAELARLTNSEPVWSGDVLKIIPYGDEVVSGNGTTFTPNVTPAYDLNDDHFQAADDEDPVRVVRKMQDDAFNIVQVEFLDRENQYNVDIADAKDQANIDVYGERPMDDVIKAHWICDRATASLVAWQILQRVLYVRNEYEFDLPFNFDLLEPMDLVTLTDAGLGLDLTPVRIKSIDDGDDEVLKIVAEEFSAGVATAARYPSQAGAGYTVDYNAAPGVTSTPAIFDAPGILTTSGYEVWLGASGGENWGGCEVWVSVDNATYRRVSVITTPARMGVLSTDYPLGDDPDTAHTLAVDLTSSRGELSSGTPADADDKTTLCWVDGELVCFSTVDLVAANRYNLTTYLRRGVYNSKIKAHVAGAQFVRLDSAIGRIPYDPAWKGKQIHIKLPAFNIYGGGLETLDSVSPYTYTIGGSISYPSNVTGFAAQQQVNTVVFICDLVSDEDLDMVEVRLLDYGDTNWNNGIPKATILRGYTVTSAAIPPGTWTFLACAKSVSGNYSPTPARFDLTVSADGYTTIRSVESSPDWPGTLTNFYRHYTGVLVPRGTKTCDQYTGWEVFDQFVPDPEPTCTYEAPEIDKGIDVPARIWGDIVSALGPGETSGIANPKLQVDVKTTSGAYGGYHDWTIGQVPFRYEKGRIILDTRIGIAKITGFRQVIDRQPVIEEKHGISIAAGGTAIVFDNAFHATPMIRAHNDGATPLLATHGASSATGTTLHLSSTAVPPADVGGTGGYTASGA